MEWTLPSRILSSDQQRSKFGMVNEFAAPNRRVLRNNNMGSGHGATQLKDNIRNMMWSKTTRDRGSTSLNERKKGQGRNENEKLCVRKRISHDLHFSTFHLTSHVLAALSSQCMILTYPYMPNLSSNVLHPMSCTTWSLFRPTLWILPGCLLDAVLLQKLAMRLQATMTQEADSQESAAEDPRAFAMQAVQMSETMNDNTKLAARVSVLQGIQTDALSECISQTCHSHLDRIQGMLQRALRAGIQSEQKLQKAFDELKSLKACLRSAGLNSTAPEDIQNMAIELCELKVALHGAGFDSRMPGQVKEAIIELHIKESRIVMQYAGINLWSFHAIKQLLADIKLYWEMQNGGAHVLADSSIDKRCRTW
ncbi:uncharacterized protein LAESUDRAFT_712494 [Laetiporus sulphureus 93-53]|uniref:Uncharacterized protein n=1 Tax=Laetiporus sulphureus 93-53 TaxID=1314785 RepID=A0A165FF30_9APHY|nr:uncharacterized protein LAESUDRAFT_712494 [Laetiporus sulphureus 93-53]KZT08873.1 hypothetical protein LAESUDRAFT_712494 [Laetiporus sulphureus 93-53]